MEFNPMIIQTLQSFGIGKEDGLSYLLSVFYNCRPSYTPTILVQKMNTTNILGLDEDKHLFWNIPLFEETPNQASTKWDWVYEWRNSFGAINKGRVGSKASVMIRMKAFFAGNPDVRKEDVLGATKMYFSSVSDPQYLVSAHFFIYKGVGKAQTSPLEEWVEKYQEFLDETPTISTDLSNQMQ